MHRTETTLRCLLALATCASPLAGQTTYRLSVDQNGNQLSAASAVSSISADGRFVLFISWATNLVPGDTNGAPDVFVLDRSLMTVKRVNVSSSGAQANDFCGFPSLSGDGRFVVFGSDADNLVLSDANDQGDIFVHDSQTAVTELVSVNNGGVQADDDSSECSISVDGSYVAFRSWATNLVAGDLNDRADIFVRDRQSATTVRVSVASNGAEGNASCFWGPAISASGRYVAFPSIASNLVPGDSNGGQDVFVRDLVSATTTRVSVTSSGTECSGGSGSGTPAISADGRFVAFESYASDMVAGDNNGFADIFVHDRMMATTSCVSVNSNGVTGHDVSTLPSVSSDGRYVAFCSYAENLLPGDMNDAPDVFVRDQQSGLTRLVNISYLGVQADAGLQTQPVITADGREVAFTSDARNLVPNDSNADWDVFVRELWPPPPTIYCTSSTSTSGCIPSIASSGAPSASASSGFTISVSQVEGQKSGLVFYGINGRLAAPWGMGSTSFLCVKPPTQRTPVQSTGGILFACDGALSLDFLAFMAANPAALGQPISAGQRYHAQAWYRDPAAPKTTNLSDALAFDLAP